MNANRFAVDIEYCNGVQFNHIHHAIQPAATEYADRLADAVVPTRTAKEAPHVRKVILEIVDTRTDYRRSVDSGTFECEHPQ